MGKHDKQVRSQPSVQGRPRARGAYRAPALVRLGALKGKVQGFSGRGRDLTLGGYFSH